MTDLDQKSPFTQVERSRFEPVLQARTACHVVCTLHQAGAPQGELWPDLCVLAQSKLLFLCSGQRRMGRTEQAHSNTSSRDIPKLSFPKQ